MTPFELIDATSARHAARLLKQHGPSAQAIAHGGDLLGLLKEAVYGPTDQAPGLLVNLATAEELRRITRGSQGLQLGAMCTLRQLQQLPGLPTMLLEAISHIASPQLRAWTTLGGNLLQRPRCPYFRHPDIRCFKKGGTGCPARQGPVEAYPGSLFPGDCHAGHPSDLAPALIALQAEALRVGADGSRWLPLEALYAGAEANPARETTLAQDDVLAAVRLPDSGAFADPGAGRGQAFAKVAPRRANEFAWASAAVVLESAAGRISQARMVLGGVAPGPWQLMEAASLLQGQPSDAIDPHAIARTLLPQAGAGVVDTRLPAARWALAQALESALRRLSRTPGS